MAKDGKKPAARMALWEQLFRGTLVTKSVSGVPGYELDPQAVREVLSGFAFVVGPLLDRDDENQREALEALDRMMRTCLGKGRL